MSIMSYSWHRKCALWNTHSFIHILFIARLAMPDCRCMLRKSPLFCNRTSVFSSNLKVPNLEALNKQFSGPANYLNPALLSLCFSSKATSIRIIKKQCCEEVRAKQSLLCGEFKRWWCIDAKRLLAESSKQQSSSAKELSTRNSACERSAALI